MRTEIAADAVPPVARCAHRIGHLRRYRDIVAVLVKFGFVDVVDALHLTPYRSGGRRLLSAVGRHLEPELSRPRRIRLALEALGPTFIKFGQALSTHADLLPAAANRQLAAGAWPAPPPAPARTRACCPSPQR